MIFDSKKQFIGVILCSYLLILSFSNEHPTGYTGAPGDSVCSSCHGGGSFSTDISLEFEPWGFYWDADTGEPTRFGWQMTILDVDDNPIGTFENQALSAGSIKSDNSGQEWLGHDPSVMDMGGFYNVEGGWDPQGYTGDATAYLVVVAANNNGGTSGDNVYTEQITFEVASSFTAEIDLSMEVEPTCHGVCNGSLTVEAMGGTPPYTYLWENGEDMATATELCFGINTVTVTDANASMVEVSYDLFEPLPFILDPGIEPAGCFGENMGLIELNNTTGGTGALSFLWDTGSNSCCIYELEAGNYEVTITDENECQEVFDFDITERPELMLQLSMTPASDITMADGTATVVVGNGGTNYTYLWSNDETTSSISGLMAGSYSVTVTDSRFCTAVGTISVGVGSCALEGILDISPIICHGDSTGFLTATVMNAVGSASYLWSDQSMGATISGLGPGTYSLTVTDEANCMISLGPITLSDPAELAVDVISLNNQECADGADGSIEVSLSGGVADYTLTWSTGLTNDTVVSIIDTLIMGTDTLFNVPQFDVTIPTQLTNLSSGIYEYTLMDGNGCLSSGAYEIVASDNQPPVLNMVEGIVYLDENGRAPAVTFDVVDNGSSDNCGIASAMLFSDPLDCTHIGVNNYEVVLTDSNGLITDGLASVQVLDTIPPVLQCATNNVVTSNCAAVTYAEPAVTDNCDIPSLQLVSGLPSGADFPIGETNITYRATDACGNSSLCTFTVTVNNNMAIAVNVSNTNCGASEGVIEIAVTGGIAPYTYSPFGPVQGGLGAGNYTVVVTDAAGCAISEFVNIESMGGPSADFLVSAVCGLQLGSIEIIPSGGTGPYTASLDGVNFTEIAAYTDLVAGVYNITIQDALGCSNAYTIEVVDDSPEGEIVPEVDLLCADSFILTTNLFSGLEYRGFPDTLVQGSYVGEVFVEAGNNCPAIVDFEVTAPPALELSNYTTTNTDGCSFSIADVVLDITGGTEPYSSELTNLGDTPVGPYTVTIVDGNGCTLTSEIIADVAYQPMSLNVGNVYICNGQLFSNPTVIGGCPPYTVVNSYDPQNTAIAIVRVTDAAGGVVFANVTEPEFENIRVENLVITNATTVPGMITLDIVGGGGTYTYEWYDENDELISTAQNLEEVAGPQTVTLIVTDDQGCQEQFQFFVDFGTSTADLLSDGHVSLFPNPTRAQVNLEFEGQLPHQLVVSSVDGRTVLAETVVVSLHRIDLSDFADGLYILRVVYEDGIILKRIIKE